MSVQYLGVIEKNSVLFICIISYLYYNGIMVDERLNKYL